MLARYIKRQNMRKKANFEGNSDSSILAQHSINDKRNEVTAVQELL